MADIYWCFAELTDARLLLRRQLKQLLPAASRQLPLAPAAPRPPPLPPGQAAVAMALGRAPPQGPPPMAVAGGLQPNWKPEQVGSPILSLHLRLVYPGMLMLVAKHTCVPLQQHLIAAIQRCKKLIRKWWI